MKREVFRLTLVVLIAAGLAHTSSNSSRQNSAGVISESVPAFVTTLNVDRTDDTAAANACTAAANDCSLRGAVIRANTTPNADPIIIKLQPATTYNLTITNANQENAAATGDLDITTSAHTVTIVGGGSSGANATLINAAALNTATRSDRVFHLTQSKVTVGFRDFRIRNGRAADDGTSGTSTNPTAQNTNRFGGGILNNGGSLTMSNVVVQTCQALGKGDSVVNDHTTLDAFGGGLASLTANGNVTVTDSTLTGNSAVGGNGGNFNNGAGSNAKGGAIYFEGGTLSIAGSRILASDAKGGMGGNGPGNQQNGGMGGMAHGGGVYVGGGNVTIHNSTLDSCSATGGNSGTGQNGTNAGADSGGGALFSLGTVRVTNSTFSMNSATGGDSGDSFGPDCFGAHQSGDGGAARGGAILADGGSVTITTATFTSNSAKGGNGGGGGKTNGGTPCAQTSHGAGGLAHGGAITNNTAATLKIEHATISLNDAKAGNTGVNQAGANLPPRPVAEGTGGGIRVGPASVTLENTIIAGNTAANGLGDAAGAPTPGPNVDGAVTSNGHNLLGVATDAAGFTGTGDKTGANAMLAALADNGGPTRTMALLAGSAAIDAGVAAGSATDQRGQPRTFDHPGTANAATSDGTDMGAFELQSRCDLCCPNNITVTVDRGKRGAIVDFQMPSARGCGRVKCDRPSGSLFPIGETIVTCVSESGPSCSFKVTVKNSQPVLRQ
ncbi:MAG TPA: choice-of-anchor Q domain-containing protein [Pyrinomonadaceae bacterium]|nr:choice-of-anchor Q domain-containing protein [Pyrinomonadaceae bacterium]